VPAEFAQLVVMTENAVTLCARQSEGPHAHAAFWECVEDLAAAYGAVFKLVLAYLNRDEASSLRRVNRAMRRAVNRAVTTLMYNPHSPILQFDLALAFPEASRLCVSWTAQAPSAATADDADAVLTGIMDSSPLLLRKIQSLEMQLTGMPSSTSLARSMAEFLSTCVCCNLAELTFGALSSHRVWPQDCLGRWEQHRAGELPLMVHSLCRCSALEDFSMTYEEGFGFLPHRFHFKGQGSTPAEIRSHLQRQITMFSSSTDFLAPSSWPACSCLISLQASYTHPLPQQLMRQLAAAMQTTSLASLHVSADGTDILNLLSNVSNLCGLTSLTIAADHVTSSTPPSVLAAIAALTNLQALDTTTSFVEGAPPTDIPPSWSQLQHLTLLRLKASSVDLRQVSMLPALQELQLGAYTTPVGTLASLFPLTGLTALHCSDEPAVPEASISSERVAVPAAWRAGLRNLEWSCRDSFCIPVVAQLTGLVDLELLDVELTPAVVR
jgi:hypothetical protein